MKQLAFSLFAMFLFSTCALAKQTVNKTIEVNHAKRVVIENVRGNIKVQTWDKNQVSILGKLDEKVEKFIAEQQGERIIIKVKTPSNLSGNGWFDNHNDDDQGSELTITMPENLALNMQGVSTDFNLSSMQQDVNVQSVSGKIDAAQIAGVVQLKTVSGDIKATDLKGEINLNSVSGNIQLNQSQGQLLVANVSGDIHVKTQATEVKANNVSGETDLQLAEIKRLQLSVVSDDANVLLNLADNASIEANSVSGDIQLKFTQSPSAHFELKSNVGGDINNELSDDKPVEAKYGPGESLSFTSGSGNGEVVVTTVSGNITVK